VHHYGGSKVTCQLRAAEIFALEQITDYPWSGDVKLVVRRAPKERLALRLRVPGWAGGAKVAVNGQAVSEPATERGYLVLSQTWQAGDEIALTLPFEARLIAADPRVEETRNQVAVMRGPLLYCVESPDLPPGVHVPDVHIPSDAAFQPALGLPGTALALGAKIATLQGQGLRRPERPWTGLYRPLSRGRLESFDLRLIPYFAWSNRGQSAMSVWMPVVLTHESP
jgi:DUF1680 family protein